MKMKQFLAILLAVLMLIPVLTLSSSAQDIYKDEYVSLAIPANYAEQSFSMNGALSQGAYYESNAVGTPTGDNFNFYILQNNPTRMTLEDMQKDTMREQIKKSALKSLNDESAGIGAAYDIHDVTDGFENSASISYYRISLSADFTYNGMSAPIYQIIVMIPINDCMVYFTYTSFESMEKAEQTASAVLKDTQILIEPEEKTDSAVWVVVLVVLGAVIGGIIGVIMALRSKKKKQASAQQAVSPYPNMQYSSGQHLNNQYPNNQYPNVPPQKPPYGNGPQNPQNPV